MSDWRVPLTDIAMPEQDVEAVLDCLRSGWLTMGPRTKAFEEALARYVGTPHVATVSSGTAALHLACQAAGLGPGDEVIVPAIHLRGQRERLPIRWRRAGPLRRSRRA